MQQFGFSADELDRARAALLASASSAPSRSATPARTRVTPNEYVRAFLEQEPIPGIEFEYKIASTFLPTVTLAEVIAEARKLIHDDNRVVLVVAPEKKDAPVPTEAALRDDDGQGREGAGRGVHRRAGRPRPGREAAGAGQGHRAARRSPRSAPRC